MSEFTYGLLYRSADAHILDTQLDKLVFVTDHDTLNSSWHIATVDMEAVGMMLEPETAGWPEEARQTKHAVTGALHNLSQTAPVLFFYNAVDHGWGYRLYREGSEAAAFDFSYEDDNPDAPVDLAASHAEQFASFGLAPAVLKQLKALLDASTIRQALREGSYFELVERFKQILGIEEMRWIP